MPSNYENFIHLFRKACSRVDVSYFQLPVSGDVLSIYRERVYCYELYHQMRLDWNLSSLSLCGEVDKSSHPIIGGNHLAKAKRGLFSRWTKTNVKPTLTMEKRSFAHAKDGVLLATNPTLYLTEVGAVALPLEKP